MNKKGKPRPMTQVNRIRAFIRVAKRLAFIADRTEGMDQQSLDRARVIIVKVIQSR